MWRWRIRPIPTIRMGEPVRLQLGIGIEGILVLSTVTRNEDGTFSATLEDPKRYELDHPKWFPFYDREQA